VIDRVRRPNLLVRATVGVVVLIVGVLVVTVMLYPPDIAVDVQGISSLLQTLESAAQDLIFFSLAVYFLITLEGRLNRRVSLRALHRLRSIVHIVDMHQLTKDPEHILLPGPDTASSPKRRFTPFELSRYLEYCSELLSLSSKLAALHVQYVNDPVVLDAVNDIEVLASNLSDRIGQKIVILDTMVMKQQGGAEVPA
jgi:hypothetical protein